VAVMAVYGQVLGHGFVSIDDPLYVSACAHVREGLTWKGFLWAWCNFDAANYHPLTWLSYMADVSVFGMEPGWMAFENALIHCLNGWLVWRVLEVLGCSRFGALLGALAFVLHPLNVESVAWISQRKTMLSAAPGLAALLIYLTRARRGVSPVNWQVLACFATSLLAKPWFVVLPVFMLVLDGVCLGRMTRADADSGGIQAVQRRLARIWPLLKEKFLLGVVLAGAVALALLSQKSAGALVGLQRAPVLFRLENAGVSVAAYLGDFFAPNALSVFYPLPAEYSAARIIGPTLLLLGLAGATWGCWRRYPEVAGGIVWFGLFLLPVIGLVQVAEQARADRYMYLPMIGLIWIAVRSVERARTQVRPFVRHALVGMAVVWLGCSGTIAERQVMYWKNSFLLSVHSMKAVGPESVLIAMLGGWYMEMEELDKALPLFEALARRPRPMTRDVLAYAKALHGLGRRTEALDLCRQLVAHDARDYYAHAYFSQWLDEAGKTAQAAEEAEKMRTIGPPYGHVPFDPQTTPAK
jgi:hypothetical protein